MSEKPENSPAFPHFGLYKGADGGHHIHPTIYNGLTLRDYFAAAALQGILANPTACDGETWGKVANTCYKMATVMLKAREASHD